MCQGYRRESYGFRFRQKESSGGAGGQSCRQGRAKLVGHLAHPAQAFEPAAHQREDGPAHSCEQPFGHDTPVGIGSSPELLLSFLRNTSKGMPTPRMNALVLSRKVRAVAAPGRINGFSSNLRALQLKECLVWIQV
jgi:hypothetical protein